VIEGNFQGRRKRSGGRKKGEGALVPMKKKEPGNRKSARAETGTGD